MTTLAGLKDDYGLGKKIFESVPSELHVDWGKSLLIIFAKHLEEVPAVVLELIVIMENQDQWKNAHDQFQKIRSLALQADKFEPHSFIVLAEKVAKITYNASGEPAPFDLTSGYYIGPLSQELAEFIDDPALNREVERVLFSAG